ncbi:hypothetical protein BLOT_004146 [Blomia tropicalis]|nr:hypothetical protein BLOT_004146 [Blomia tropicalis]
MDSIQSGDGSGLFRHLILLDNHHDPKRIEFIFQIEWLSSNERGVGHVVSTVAAIAEGVISVGRGAERDQIEPTLAMKGIRMRQDGQSCTNRSYLQ